MGAAREIEKYCCGELAAYWQTAERFNFDAKSELDVDPSIKDGVFGIFKTLPGSLFMVLIRLISPLNEPT